VRGWKSIALASTLILAGVCCGLASYFLSYRPAKQAYEELAAEIEQLLAEQKTAAAGWAEVGSIVSAAGNTELTQVVTGELAKAGNAAVDLRKQLPSSPQKAALDTAYERLRLHFAIAAIPIALGLGMFVWLARQAMEESDP
jgi:hypothetical protein